MSETDALRRIKQMVADGTMTPGPVAMARAGYREGYAQAVRDVMADIEQEFEPRLADWLRGWAEERGIVIEENGHE